MACKYLFNRVHGSECISYGVEFHNCVKNPHLSNQAQFYQAKTLSVKSAATVHVSKFGACFLCGACAFFFFFHVLVLTRHAVHQLPTNQSYWPCEGEILYANEEGKTKQKNHTSLTFFITLTGQPVPVFTHPSCFYSSVKKNLQVLQFMPVASCPYTRDVLEINICKNNRVSCAQEFEML